MKKRYKVTVKVEYEITMDRTQTSMKKAEEDVRRLINDYLDKNNNLDVRWLFNDIRPRTIYKVVIVNEENE